MWPDTQSWKRLRPGRPAVRQALGLACVSAVLGLAYNAASPIGIRWTTAPTAPSPDPGKPLSDVHQANQPPPLAGAETASAPPPPLERTPILPRRAGQGDPQPAPPPSHREGATPGYVAPTPTTWPEVEPRLARGELVLVDSRSSAAYQAAHIPGAVSLPEPPSPEQLRAFRERYPTSAHVVTYCGSTSCSISFRSAQRLAREAGYGFVQYMTGGFQAWQRDQALKTEAGTVATPAEALLSSSAAAVRSGATNDTHRPSRPAIDPPVTPPIDGALPDQPLENALPISWSQVRPLLEIGQVVLVDARPAEAYEAGHIPGAISVPSDSPAALVHSRLESFAPSTRLVAYCQSMGCPEGFQLATRLLREFEFLNTQFLFEGYADWVRLRASSGGGAP